MVVVRGKVEDVVNDDERVTDAELGKRDWRQIGRPAAGKRR